MSDEFWIILVSATVGAIFNARLGFFVMLLLSATSAALRYRGLS